LALSARLQGGFNVGTGRETDVNALVAALLASSPQQVDVVHAAPRAGEQRRSVIDPAKLRAAGWSTTVDVAEGLARTFRWFAAQRG